MATLMQHDRRDDADADDYLRARGRNYAPTLAFMFVSFCLLVAESI